MISVTVKKTAMTALIIAAAAVLVAVLFTAQVHAAENVTIGEPSNNAVFEVNKEVTIRISAKYERLPGFGNLLKQNYIYCRITTNGQTVYYSNASYQSTLSSLNAKVFRFTPKTEGRYTIEACRDLTYVDGNHVDLDEEDFVAEEGKTIIVQKDLTKAETVITGLEDKEYTGGQLTQTPVVTVDGKTLDPSTDYDLSYENNINAGQAKLTVTGKGFYKKSVSTTFNVLPADISGSQMKGVVDKTYSGSALTQSPSVIWNNRILAEGSEYDLEYENNINAGTATVKAIGKVNFTGEISKTFQIGKVSIWEASEPSVVNKTYTGNPITQDLNMRYGGKNLALDEDFTATYKNNVQPGTATVTITGKGNFKDSLVRTFSINEPAGSSGAGATVLAPEDHVEYPVGSEVTVKTRSGIFKTPYYNGSPLNNAPNFIYVKITRNGERVGYETCLIYSTSDIAEVKFTADKKGDYLIEVSYLAFIIESVENTETGFKIHYKQIAYEDFTADDSVTVHVGTSAPGSRKDISSASISGVSNKEYTGNSITQTPTVKYNGTTLKNGTDYYVTYKSKTYTAVNNNIDIGEVEMTVHGKGNYTGTVSKTFQITPKKITADMITLTPSSSVYSGALQKPQVTVMNGSCRLHDPVDCRITNEGGTEPGTYDVQVTGNGNYTGSATKKFTIGKQPVKAAAVICSPESFIYDGSEKTPAVTIRLDGADLPVDAFNVAYSNNKNAGEAKVTVTAKADSYFTGSTAGTFTIERRSLASDDFAVDLPSNVTFDRKAQEPVPVITWNGNALEATKEYTVTYKNNTNAGIAEVTISGAGNFTGARTQTFTIDRKSLSDESLTVDPIGYQLYVEGTPSVPEVIVRDGDFVLTQEDMEIQYVDNDKPGTASANIKGKGNYKGELAVQFTILEKGEFLRASIQDIVTEIEVGLNQYLSDDKATLESAVNTAKELLAGTDITEDQLEQELDDLSTLKLTADENLRIWKEKEQAALKLPSSKDTEKSILAQKTDKDPKGSAISPLVLRSTKQSKKYIVLSWKKVSGASSYVIYGNKCGNSRRIRKLATVKKNTYTHKKLKKGTYYKYIVVAVKDTVIGKRAAAVSKMIHVPTKGGKYGSYKSVKVSKSILSKAKVMKTGKTLKLGAKAVKSSSRVRTHVKLRYQSTNKKVATVSSKGVIKAVKKGTCYVYAYAQSGAYKKITVKVVK